MPRPIDDLVRRLRAGDQEARAQFFTEMDGVIRRSCRVASGARNTEDIFRHVCAELEKNKFEKLSAFSSNHLLTTFVTLVIREILTSHMLQLLTDNPGEGWRIFLTLYDKNIRNKLEVYFPESEVTREDARFSIEEALFKNDYKRLKAFKGINADGKKSLYAGYINRVISNLCRDFIVNRDGRQRLPAPIERLSLLHQLVYIQIYWENARPIPNDLRPRLSIRRPEGVKASEVEQALRNVTNEDIESAIKTVTENLRKPKPPKLRPAGDENSSDSPDEPDAPDEPNDIIGQALKVLLPFIKSLNEKEQRQIRLILNDVKTPGRPADNTALMQKLREEAIKHPEVISFLRLIMHEDYDLSGFKQAGRPGLHEGDGLDDDRDDDDSNAG